MVDTFSFGYERTGAGPELTFNRNNVNKPTDENARWLMQQLYEALNLDESQRRNRERPPILKNVFRRDIFERALEGGEPKTEGSEIGAEAVPVLVR